MRTLSKAAAGIGAAALVVTTAGVAYAYWTTTGSGSGSATTGDTVAADAIQIVQSAALTGFYPGSTAQDVKVTAKNPAAFSQKVGNVTVSVAAAGGCAASNWAVVDAADAIGVLASGITSGSTTVATIQLLETGLNQDACKGVTPVLTFASAQGA